MARVFTITEGLENMGALRTGGQGSVYKARRKDGTITAVKLLPTPIFSESAEDKNYRDFRNEVEKLKRVNETQNPHIVTILNSGVTETGNFPFIEMEFIQGPDLEELLKPPHPPVFSIQEAIKVARHISNAIAHCHRLEVKHGDIKTNNVKLNERTGNYVLLDFGLAVMSDEQRRTSLRHAGAIEFMAPEQNEGQMLFQTDVYSFGIIIYELLAGRVPFPLKDKGETARNNVMVSHMETPVPDVVQVRAQQIPGNWKGEKRAREMNIPAWLLEMLDRCLKKHPEERFANGMELFGFIHFHAGEQTLVTQSAATTYEETMVSELAPEVETPVYEPLAQTADTTATNSVKRSRNSGLLWLLPLLLLLGLGGYFIVKHSGNSQIISSNNTVPSDSGFINGVDTNTIQPVKEKPKKLKKDTLDTLVNSDVPVASVKADDYEKNMTPSHTDPDSMATPAQTEAGNANTSGKPDDKKTGSSSGRYKVRSQAYFYNDPDESTRRNAFMTQWDGNFTALDETDDFIYVVFTNSEGQTSKGWLRKKDLIHLR